MSGIPERGYGSFRQWRRRVMARKGEDAVALFYVDESFNGEHSDWQSAHMKYLPADWQGMGSSNVREATEAQRARV